MIKKIAVGQSITIMVILSSFFITSILKLSTPIVKKNGERSGLKEQLIKYLEYVFYLFTEKCKNKGLTLQGR